MASLTVIALSFTLFTYVSIFGEGQEIFFGLKYNRKVDQALKLNETDVIITCNMSCISAASIQIKAIHVFGSVSEDLEGVNESEHSIDHRIPAISEDLQFQCLVTYNMSSTEITKEAYWSPHVIMGPDAPYCLRNGTVSQPYNIGDILLLKCFCDIAQSCKWQAITTVNSAEVERTNLDFSSTLITETRIVLQTVVGPIESLPADHFKTFICQSNVSFLIKSCVIQPINVSSRDNVATPAQSPKCDVLENLDEQIPLDSTIPSGWMDYVLFIIIGAASLLAISILVLFVVVVCVRAKRRQNRAGRRRETRNESHTSDASEFHPYDNSTPSYTLSMHPLYDSAPSSSMKDDNKDVEETRVDDTYTSSYPYYYPFGIEGSDFPTYNNVTPYVNGAQV